MTAAQEPILSASGLSLRYSGAAHPVLANFDLALRPREIVTVIGPSGAGKSSLLRVLGGIEVPTSGEVRMNGAPLRHVHPRVAIAFQNPGLLPWLSLERNVAFGLDFKRQPKLNALERRARVDRAIAEVGLARARRLHPAALSGGMAQRTSLARCLARQPEVLLLDEPFGALDEITRADMQQLLLKLVDTFGTAVVLITHDIDEALLVSDRIILLGGSPARETGQWQIDVPHPRADRLTELGQIRIEIVKALRLATVRSH
ncbi:ABC transporter ATP-binding protein [Hyphomicrobium sp. 99]|uniref:ABC transporter ATP-binding protein n=1 Tax=Hyphomicrobium sp. 99 TaxID=1163419 RepID=UPI0005F7E234|nr:ABC transporter ATP-binding protein [Hyphomicrobium sp. 99]